MASGGIVRLGLNAEGRLSGKLQLRRYWSMALSRLPGLHFTLLDVSTSPDSVIVRYRNERGHTVSEYLRLDDSGLIVQGSANHLVG